MNRKDNWSDEKWFYDLPIGYRFAPTDEELVHHYYLKNKATNCHVPCSPIYDVALYDFHPKKLSEKYKLNRKIVKEREWYFFTSRDRKYPNGKRPKRSTGEGAGWKATGTERSIVIAGHKTATRKCLDYYENGKRTDWKMHEFVLSPGFLASTSTNCPLPPHNNMQVSLY